MLLSLAIFVRQKCQKMSIATYISMTQNPEGDWYSTLNGPRTRDGSATGTNDAT